MNTLRVLHRLLNDAHRNGNNRTINVPVATAIGRRVIPGLLKNTISELRAVSLRNRISDADRHMAHFVQSEALRLTREYSEEILASGTVDVVKRRVLDISAIVETIDFRWSTHQGRRRA